MRSRKFIYLLVILLVFTNTVYGTSVSATEMDENEVVIVDNTSGEDREGGASSDDGTDGNTGNDLIEDNADNQDTEIIEDDELNLDSQDEGNDGVSSENKNVSNDDVSGGNLDTSNDGVSNEEQNTSNDDVFNENDNMSSDDEILDENNEEPVANSFMLPSAALMSDDGIMLMDSDDNDTDVLNSSVYVQSISSADDLADLADIVNKTTTDQYSSFQITVTTNINLSNLSSDKTFASIGTEENPFIGTFEGKDGNNKTITLNGQSLFGVVGSDSVETTISNITVIGSDFTSSTEKNTGALIQKATNTTISSCTNNIDITNNYSDSGDSVGGIVGYGSNVIINKCENYGDIKGTTYVGGIIGYGKTVSISESTNGNDVEGTTYVGGIIGYADSVTLNGCTNKTNVTGAYAGGMIGQGVAVSLTYCINSAKITGTTSVGGMIGDASSSSVIKFCLNSGSINGGTNAGGMIGHGDGTSSTNFCYNSGTITGANIGNTIGSTVITDSTDSTDNTTVTGNGFALTSPQSSYTWGNMISVDLADCTIKDDSSYVVTYELPSATNCEILDEDGDKVTITLSDYDLLKITDSTLTLGTATDTLSPRTYSYYIYLTCNNITKSQTLTITIDARDFSSSDFTFNEKSLSEVTTAGLSYDGTDDSTYVTVDSKIWTKDDYAVSYVFDPVTWTTTMTITPVPTVDGGITVYPTGMSDSATSFTETFSVAKRTSDVAAKLEAGTSYRFPWDMVGIKNPAGDTDGCTYTAGNDFYVATTGDYTYTVSVE